MPDTLNSGQSLNIVQQLQSNNGRYVLLMQDDGNLVLYEGVPSVASARWGSNTFNLAPLNPVRADMQADGNFVLVTAINLPVWATQTHGNPGSKLVLQDDRNLVIYDPTNRALWASNTMVPAAAVPVAPITAVSPPPGSRDAQRGWGLEVGW